MCSTSAVSAILHLAFQGAPAVGNDIRSIVTVCMMSHCWHSDICTLQEVKRSSTFRRLDSMWQVAWIPLRGLCRLDRMSIVPISMALHFDWHKGAPTPENYRNVYNVIPKTVLALYSFWSCFGIHSDINIRQVHPLAFRISCSFRPFPTEVYLGMGSNRK